jgi:hypothetical protein
VWSVMFVISAAGWNDGHYTDICMQCKKKYIRKPV